MMRCQPATAETRSKVRWIIDLPPISTKGFPGKRVDAKRAGITATTFLPCIMGIEPFMLKFSPNLHIICGESVGRRWKKYTRILFREIFGAPGISEMHNIQNAGSRRVWTTEPTGIK